MHLGASKVYQLNFITILGQLHVFDCMKLPVPFSCLQNKNIISVTLKDYLGLNTKLSFQLEDVFISLLFNRNHVLLVRRTCLYVWIVSFCIGLVLIVCKNLPQPKANLCVC